MNMTLSQLAGVAREIDRRLGRAAVQEVRCPSATSIWIGAFSGGSAAIYIDVAPGLARCHITQRRTATLTPVPRFCAKLRHDLVSARLSGALMPFPDRVLVLSFARGDEDRLLIFECSGHHANLFLCDGEFKIVMSLLPSASHKRELAAGSTYRPPPAPESPRSPRITVHEPRATNHEPRNPSETGCDSPSEALEHLYDAELASRLFVATRNRLRQMVQAALRHEKAALLRIEADLGRIDEYRQMGRWGELLKMNLGAVRKGMTRVEVADVFDESGRMVEIALRPELSPVENMEWLFSRYRKGVRGQEAASRRRRDVSARKLELERLLAELESASTQVELDLLAERISRGRSSGLPASLLRRGSAGSASVPDSAGRQPENQEHRAFKEFLSTSGRLILVGKGGKDNHCLTFQIASPHDVWLHVRGFPGSHVTIPVSRGQEPDPETLLDAAHLAVQHSKAPKTGFVEVMWARRFHVRAVKKGRPGEVMVSNEHNLGFEFDPGRLKRVESVR